MDGYGVGSIRVLYRAPSGTLEATGFKGFSFANPELELCTARQKAPGPKRSRGFWSTGSVVKRQRFVRDAAALIRRSA